MARRELTYMARPLLGGRKLDEFNAVDLLLTPEADVFTRVLDLSGWMIVVKPELRQWHHLDPHWLMNGSGYCPTWAEPYDAWPSKPKPVLKIITGDKPPEPTPEPK
jgi:hypothetical protein